MFPRIERETKRGWGEVWMYGYILLKSVAILLPYWLYLFVAELL